MCGMRETTDDRLQQFVRGLYFDLQRVDGVKPLEIWNGVREYFDPYEKATLAKNLYKVALPLVNEACFGRPFEQHGATARAAVEQTAAWFVESPGPRLFDRFPDPPIGEGAEKDVYRLVRERMRERVRALVGERAAPAAAGPARRRALPRRALRLPRDADRRQRDAVHHLHGQGVPGHPRAGRRLPVADRPRRDLLRHARRPRRRPGARRRVPRVRRGRCTARTRSRCRGRRWTPGSSRRTSTRSCSTTDYLDLFEDVYRWFESAAERSSAAAEHAEGAAGRDGPRPSPRAASAQPTFGRSFSAFRMASSGYS